MSVHEYHIGTSQIRRLSTVNDALATARERLWYGSTMHNATVHIHSYIIHNFPAQWYVFGGAKNAIGAADNDMMAMDMVHTRAPTHRDTYIGHNELVGRSTRR